MEKRIKSKDGLSITSLVLSIVGILLCVTIIGAILGIPITIIALIFGIIALIKKQKKGIAVAGIIISGLTIIISATLVTIGFIFLKNNSDVIIEPIKDFSQMIEQNPELSELMRNKEFANEFEYEFKNRMIEKFNEETEIENRDEAKIYIPSIFEEMKDLMLELQKKYQTE